MGDNRNGDHRFSMVKGILNMICHDLYSMIDMAESLDLEEMKRVLRSTHERYAALSGKEYSDVDVEVDVDIEKPDDVEDRYNYRVMSKAYPGREAVEDPTDAQKSDLPSAAYEPAAWFDGDDGEFDPDGEFQSSKSKLPHHINTVNDPNENSTVDVPRLRNAMARFDQVDWAGFPQKTRTAAKAHLERHADAILYGNDENTCATCSKEEIDMLRSDLSDFRMQRYGNIAKRLST